MPSLSMPEKQPKARSTIARRMQRAGYVAVRIGGRSYWLPKAEASRIERLCQKAEKESRNAETS